MGCGGDGGGAGAGAQSGQPRRGQGARARALQRRRRRPWAWMWRPSPRETGGHFQRRVRHVWCTTQGCYRMERSLIPPEIETNLSGSRLADKKSLKDLRKELHR